MSEHKKRVTLEQRVSILEERLGIDPHAVIADGEEQLARGAEAAALSEPAEVDETEDENEAEDE